MLQTPTSIHHLQDIIVITRLDESTLRAGEASSSLRDPRTGKRETRCATDAPNMITKPRIKGFARQLREARVRLIPRTRCSYKIFALRCCEFREEVSWTT